jgi:hypothetical protein
MQRRESAVAACGRNYADRPQSARGHSRCAILSSQLCDRLAAMKLLPDGIFGWSTFETDSLTFKLEIENILILTTQ